MSEKEVLVVVKYDEDGIDVTCTFYTDHTLVERYLNEHGEEHSEPYVGEWKINGDGAVECRKTDDNNNFGWMHERFTENVISAIVEQELLRE